MSGDAIKGLARHTAQAGLKRRDALALFEALYMADAIMLSGGDKTRAADRAGVSRFAIYRARDRATVTGKG